MSTKTYDPKNVAITVNGVYITGLGESMVEITKDENSYETKVGALGDVVRTKINNSLGTIKITLQQTSPQLSYLDTLANSGKVVPISIISSNDPKETTSVTEAFLKKPADRKYGKEAEDREYEFQALDLKME
ncbi:MULTISPECIES: DUF3277 family protein [Paenibacillus]|uniref:DUF3277 family protein n=1 Tax=Paenibacillus radicis (ex Xue et al. 2023) TaxID=2972489 RepID=A0ABT1YSL7_9BACL|nr:DUF3277 family protein [Paenibacillus radicis (ex Xue et al. 2023)]MCR8636182.1 DUF3277 family protein [Paenibacillus radicis (ex Xue et al. 2023)]